MNVNIYGHPYHSLDYHFYTKEELVILFMKYTIQTVLNYVDGSFAIQILKDNEEIWITDYYGLYPVFYNPIEKKVCVNFTKDMNLEIEYKYIDLCKKNIDKQFKSNYPTQSIDDSLFIIFDYFFQKNKISICNKYNITPWKNWFVLPPSCICIIRNNELIIKKYDIDSDFYITSPEIIFIESIKKVIKNHICLLSLSAGYDSRAIYSVVDNCDVFTRDIEYEYVNKWAKTINIQMDEIFFEKNKTDFIHQLNGMCDVCAIKNFFMSFKLYYNYDLLLYGVGANQWLSGYTGILWQLRYATGLGHFYKLESNKIKTFSPFLQKRLIVAYKKNYQTKQNGFEKNHFCRNIIEQQKRYDLLKINFVRIYMRKYSNKKSYLSTKTWGYSYNTKYNYLSEYYKLYNLDIEEKEYEYRILRTSIS